MNYKKTQPIHILMADDDEDDRLLAQDALEESRVLNAFQFVKDGVELLEYLRNDISLLTSNSTQDRISFYLT